jgi:hypothetical protein
MTESVNGRIFFHGNPWPQGHRIENVIWGASIHPEYGLRLELTLNSALYYEGEEADFPFTAAKFDADEDWKAKAAWANYHECTLSPSTTAFGGGIVLSDGTSPFDFDRPHQTYTADPLPVDMEKFRSSNAFDLYLLGHDAVADHAISLVRSSANGTYDLNWSGKIALTYTGDEEFRHSFEAHATGVRFDAITLWYFDPETAMTQLGIKMDPNLTPRDYIAPYVVNPDDFVFERRLKTLYAVRKRP